MKTVGGLNRNIPLIIIRIITFWYQTQPMCIKCGKISAAYFEVSNANAKIFKICLIEMLEKHLHTHDHQFGLTKQHSTDM